MSLLTRLESFDRRWIFLAMALAVVIPLIYPLGLPVEPSPPVKAIYDTIEDLPPNSTVLVSIDLDPAATSVDPIFADDGPLHQPERFYLSAWVNPGFDSSETQPRAVLARWQDEDLARVELRESSDGVADRSHLLQLLLILELWQRENGINAVR